MRSTPSPRRSANKTLNTALQEHSGNADLLLTVANARVVQERYSEAIELYQQVLRLRPRDVIALNNYATLLSEKKDRQQQALQLIEQAIEMEGPAMAAAERAVELDPSSAQAQIALGEALRIRSRDWRRMERVYEKGLELDPGNADVQIEYGWFLQATGRAAQSIPYMETAVRLDPFSPLVLWSAAMAHRFNREHDLAIEYAVRALENDPDFIPAGFNAVDFAIEGRLDEAKALIQRSIELSGSRPSPHLLSVLAFVHSRAGEEAKVREVLERLIDQYENEVGMAFAVACVYGFLGTKYGYSS